jgi:hypothetical protein
MAIAAKHSLQKGYPGYYGYLPIYKLFLKISILLGNFCNKTIIAKPVMALFAYCISQPQMV